MARFLTPSKTSLLALAVLYSEGSVPLSSMTHVLSFVVRHISPDSKISNGKLSERSGNPSIVAFENAFSNLESTVPGRSIWDLLLKKLWALDCFDAIDTFFTDLPILLAKSRDQLIRERDSGEVSDLPFGKIIRTSPLGLFIRKCHLEYTRIHFQDSITIWQDFIIYRSHTRSAYEKKYPNAHAEHNALDVNLSEFGIDSSHPISQIMYGHLLDHEDQVSPKWSNQDVDRLLEFQVSEMQHLGSRLPQDVKTKLEQMSTAGATLSRYSHYLKFLESWRAGDFASAFDNLHRYFDYTMQNRDRTFYQYALLNLAVLQADFGCYKEAIPAIQEAIATARENKDTICLNYCMSWFYHFGRTFPTQMREVREKGMLGGEIEGLQFLKSRAKDAEMWSLLGSVLLSEAKLGLQRGESVAVMFESIVKASHISIVKSLPDVAGPVLLMKAAVFSRIGQTHLASMCFEIFLECHQDNASLEDILRASCPLSALLARQGRYAEADAVLENVPANVLRVLKLNNYWNFHAAILRLRRLLHHNDLDAARLVLCRLQDQDAPDFDHKATLALLEIDYLMRRNELNTALSRIEDLASMSYVEFNDITLQVKLLTTKAQLLAKAGQPLKGFSITMRAASLAFNARMLPVLWDAIIALGTILVCLEEFDATKSLLETILPQILECQDCDLTARAHSVLADVYMGMAALADGDEIRQEHVTMGIHNVDRALEQWEFIEDLNGQLECLSKKAHVQFWRGDVEPADDIASNFMELREKYISARG